MGTSEDRQTSELRDLIARLTVRDGDHQTSIESLYLTRYSSPKSPDFGVTYPGLCLVAQGQKELLLGGEVFVSTPGEYLVSSAEIPISARVVGATQAKLHLGLRLNFDLANLRALIQDAQLPTPFGGSPRGIYV